MESGESRRPSKRIAVFCDGTWVGRETAVEDAPASNIRQLADMVGEVQYNDSDKTAATVHRIAPHRTLSNARNGPDAIVAGYQEGVGLNKNFMQYIWDGATASSISEECISVYRFIVDNYTDDHEIWLFGFSRGAFTVRCVAGMINNCGIIKRRDDYTDTEVSRLCYEVFRTYRSSLPSDAPKSEECKRWRGLEDRVWQVKRPIRFMGIIDTVGALGIPRLSAGVGFDWSPFEFFDQSISSVVQYCHHAPCLHDRLWTFQPCLVSPTEELEDANEPKAIIREKWFPGTHYDVGRMTFRFLRQSPTNWIEEALGWLPDLFSRTIYPNQVLSDTVLRWMVESVYAVDEYSENPIMPGARETIRCLSERIVEAALLSSKKDGNHIRVGSGDIYGDVLAYAPGGVVITSLRKTTHTITSLLNNVAPRLGDMIQSVLGVKTLIGILTNTADRRIPGTEADVYPYTERETTTVRGNEITFTVQDAAQMMVPNENKQIRYPSQTFESFLLWKEVFGRRDGKLDKAEEMYKRALKGKEAASDSNNAPTTLVSRNKEAEVDLGPSLDADVQVPVSPVADQDELRREQDEYGLCSHAVAEIGCGCLPATEIANKPAARHVLAEMAERLPSHWREVQEQLPDSYKRDIEFVTDCLEGAAGNGCWTCTPLVDGEPEQIPLTIAQAPVVIPVEHRWPPVGGVNPPPDPRASSLINPWSELPIDVIRDLFLTFEGALGFYILVSGLLQVIVPDTFETAWASSHLPHSFGGLKVCYIADNMEPSAARSNVSIAPTTSPTSQTPTLQFIHPPIQSQSAQSLQINDLIEARVLFAPRDKFGGRIGLKIAKNVQPDQSYLVMSTHVITQAILSKLSSNLRRNPVKQLQGDWNKYAGIWAGDSKIGIIEKSFDPAAEYYPSGFNHDVTLIKPYKDKEDLVAGIQSPIDKLGWLSRDAWSSLRQHPAAVKILGPTGPVKSARCIKCHTTSEVAIVGEGVFLNQSAAAGKKTLESHDESFWRKFVSRAVLYRVNPDFSTPNGYSGVALWTDGKREDGTQGPGIVGFQSFVQRSGHTQNFNMPEGPHLEQRLRKGLVAFYGAFQVPDELRQEYTIL